MEIYCWRISLPLIYRTHIERNRGTFSMALFPVLYKHFECWENTCKSCKCVIYSLINQLQPIARLALASVLLPFVVHLLTSLPALMHYLGSLQFPVICDTHEAYLIYPTINLWKPLVFRLLLELCQFVVILKRRIIEPSLTAFILFPFALVLHVRSRNALHNITKFMSSTGITMNGLQDILEMCTWV